jgi:hypothetical protein
MLLRELLERLEKQAPVSVMLRAATPDSRRAGW